MTKDQKTLMFILLELFTIRILNKYPLKSIDGMRDFVKKTLQKDIIDDFKVRLYSDAVYLSLEEFKIVKDFIGYLNNIDKIVKM